MAVGVGQGSAYGAATCAGLAFIMLIFACASPWTLWGGYTVANSWISFGVGPFVAGYTSTPYAWSPYGWYVVASSVLWSELNSQNVCTNQASPVFTDWALPNGLCGGNGNTVFVMPPQIMGIQACVVLATIFSFFTCVLGCSVSASRGGGGYGAAVSSFLALIFCICAFAIWTTWPMSTKLLNSPGSQIPVWTSTGQLGLSPQVWLGYGSTYITTVISFVFLLFSTVTLFSVANRLDSEPSDGPFGAGI